MFCVAAHINIKSKTKYCFWHFVCKMKMKVFPSFAFSSFIVFVLHYVQQQQQQKVGACTEVYNLLLLILLRFVSVKI
jgi:hypothetical protein